VSVIFAFNVCSCSLVGRLTFTITGRYRPGQVCSRKEEGFC
jgi:hypothetical protein